MKDVFKILREIGIEYQQYDHPAVFTVEEAEKYAREDGAHSKNLFLRNKKGNKHFLVILEGSKRVDLKNLAKLVGESDLSFASGERLLKLLRLTPGSVSPFGLINDEGKEVHVIVDKSLLVFDMQGFHPNVNTSTLVITTKNFKKFLEWTKNQISYLNI
jgi:Ala-tRNA(Pro) deacylase